MTQTQTPQPQATKSSQSGRTGVGLSDDNPVIGAAVHRDLFRVPKDPAEERRELAKQSRVLAMGFLVVFTGIIGGLSIGVFNGALKPGLAVTLPLPPNAEEPGWADAERKVENAVALDLRARPPVISATGKNGDWKPLEHLELVFNHEDDPKPEAVAGLTPVHVWQGRHRVAVGYIATPSQADLAQLKVALPNIEPAPVRSCAADALQRAKLLRLVPTRYVAGFGLLMGLLGLLAPALLIPFYEFWMRYVTAPLGWFNTRLILGIVWVLMFTPIAVLRRLLGSDPLRARSQPKDKTYWLDHAKRDRKHFARGF
ncbi:MAG: SxtJ family membrane protein [Planctomycetota bacterium]